LLVARGGGKREKKTAILFSTEKKKIKKEGEGKYDWEGKGCSLLDKRSGEKGKGSTTPKKKGAGKREGLAYYPVAGKMEKKVFRHSSEEGKEKRPS